MWTAELWTISIYHVEVMPPVGMSHNLVESLSVAAHTLKTYDLIYATLKNCAHIHTYTYRQGGHIVLLYRLVFLSNWNLIICHHKWILSKWFCFHCIFLNICHGAFPLQKVAHFYLFYHNIPIPLIFIPSSYHLIANYV